MRLQASTHLLLFLEIIFLGLSSTRAADHGPVAVQAIQLHHGKAGMHPNELVSQHTNVLAAEVCRRVAALLQQKVIAINRLQAATYAVAKDDNLSAEERIFQIHTLDIIQKELNESEASIFQAVLGLHRALQGDYRDILNMKESSKQRLEALREAAIKEEQEFIQLSLAERHKTEALKRQRVRNSSRSLVDSLMEDVRMAADRLEEEIQEHAFDNSKFVKGVHVEAVLRVAGMDSDQQREFNGTLMDDHINDLGLSMLIDSLNNQYILARPRDSTIPRSDHHFIKDIVLLMLFSLPCGWLCCHMKLPTMLGYIICGVLLGPSSLNMIKSLVQVETLGEFGVFFIIFFVGLEFSPDKLRKVWQISLQTPLAILFLMSVAGLAWGYGLNIAPKQSLFISACLSLSSTPLVSKFLSGHARPHREDEPDYGTLLLGMLVMQDMEMSLIIALMPTVTQARRASTDRTARVPNFCPLRVFHPTLPHSFCRHSEVFCRCVGAHLATSQELPVHALASGIRPCSGQRVFLRAGQPCSTDWHNFPRGLPAHLERDYIEPPAGSCPLEVGIGTLPATGKVYLCLMTGTHSEGAQTSFLSKQKALDADVIMHRPF
uniref:transmembrane and coiled-coil domain-containing protein 3 isoform X4 n=1 Tax=Myxine glutinosa TaxID=7769 RepID=UPI00358EE63A